MPGQVCAFGRIKTDKNVEICLHFCCYRLWENRKFHFDLFEVVQTKKTDFLYDDALSDVMRS